MTSGRRVLFVTGGGSVVGLGHVRRCVTLAEALRRVGVESLFLVEGDAVIVEWAKATGFSTQPISPEADAEEAWHCIQGYQAEAVVVDSYRLQSDYYRTLAGRGVLIAAIDDLADRELPVDLVVNGSIGAEDLPYRVATHTQLILGPQYILLRPEFNMSPRRTIAGEARRALITVGGSDPRNLTPRLMCWAVAAIPGITLDVMVGPLFTNRASIAYVARGMAGRATLHFDPPNMRCLMLMADLALSGGGQTLYELAATGTPTIAIRTADNQTLNLIGFTKAEAIVWAGDAVDGELEGRVKQSVSQLAGDVARRTALGERGRTLVDGRGAERTARVIVERIGIPQA